MVRQLLAAGCHKETANNVDATLMHEAVSNRHKGAQVVCELLGSFYDMSAVVPLRGCDDLKVLFREHCSIFSRTSVFLYQMPGAFGVE